MRDFEIVSRHPNHLSPGVITAFFIMNLAGVSLIVILFLKYFIDQKDQAYRLLRIEERKAQDLLLNILPREIAAILKEDTRTIADQFDGASILFADIVSFTPMSEKMTPEELVSLLNEVFSHIDMLGERYGLEKIKRIGDCYMAAAGVPRTRPDHAHALARLALDIQEYVEQNLIQGRQHHLRIGINSGPVSSRRCRCRTARTSSPAAA